VFNPSFPYRFAHMVNAAYLTTSFVVLAVGARYLLASRHIEEARTMLRMAVGFIAIVAPLQLFIGDQHGLNTLKHQPIKIAAMEAHWESDKPVDFHIFAWPDEKAETNHWALSIPNAGSLILTHRLNGQIIGLKDVAPQNRPPVKTVFFAFRIMLAIGFFMIAAALIGAWLLWRGILFETRWYLRVVAHSWWTGFVAVTAGWVVTESGRQPWVVQGILRTADATSPHAASTVLTSLVLFVIVYAIVFAMGIYYINRLIERGPQGRAVEPPERGSPSRPLAAAHDAGREALARGS
jgi:cytochrome d ubiquinol oxidase subunit I